MYEGREYTAEDAKITADKISAKITEALTMTYGDLMKVSQEMEKEFSMFRNFIDRQLNENPNNPKIKQYNTLYHIYLRLFLGAAENANLEKAIAKDIKEGNITDLNIKFWVLIADVGNRISLIEKGKMYLEILAKGTEAQKSAAKDMLKNNKPLRELLDKANKIKVQHSDAPEIDLPRNFSEEKKQKQAISKTNIGAFLTLLEEVVGLATKEKVGSFDEIRPLLIHGSESQKLSHIKTKADERLNAVFSKRRGGSATLYQAIKEFDPLNPERGIAMLKEAKKQFEPELRQIHRIHK